MWSYDPIRQTTKRLRLIYSSHHILRIFSYSSFTVHCYGAYLLVQEISINFHQLNTTFVLLLVLVGLPQV